MGLWWRNLGGRAKVGNEDVECHSNGKAERESSSEEEEERRLQKTASDRH